MFEFDPNLIREDDSEDEDDGSVYYTKKEEEVSEHVGSYNTN